MRMRWGCAALVAAAIAGCGGGTSTTKQGTGGGGGGGGGTTPVKPPVVVGAYTFYGADQGFPRDVFDASADEGGNVYVAAGEAVLAKRRDDRDFLRFDPAAAGLTKSCHDPSQIANPNPPDPAAACPAVSVGGTAAGRAVVGYQGVGTDGEFPQNAEWAIDSGGADVVTFDGEKLARSRRVQIAGWPQQFCEDHSDPRTTGKACAGDDMWTKGRRKVRQVLRIAVNHRTGTPQALDVWFAGAHGTFSLLVDKPAERGMPDLSGQFPGTEARVGVWEHDHPAIFSYRGGPTGTLEYLTGESHAIAVDPLTGDPWAANAFRLAGKVGYARTDWNAPMWPPDSGRWDDPRSFLDVWPDKIPADFGQYDAFDPATEDDTESVSFCDDGTLWVASGTKGLARLTIDRAAIAANPGVDPKRAVSVQYVDLPPGLGNDAWAVACDGDSVWVGFGWGGFARLRNGAWEWPPAGTPAFTSNPVRSIQVDRWTTPHRIFLSHVSSTKYGPGGLTVYSGP